MNPIQNPSNSPENTAFSSANSGQFGPQWYKLSLLNGLSLCFLGAYFVLSAFAFVLVVEPSLAGLSNWRIYDDSNVYVSIAKFVRSQDENVALVGLLSLARNLVLPVLEVLVLQTPRNIALFNVVIFGVALCALASTFKEFKWYIFLPFILISPTTFQALFTLNKEIFALLCAVILACWFRSGRLHAMLVLLTISFILRWEQALVILIYLVLRKSRMPRRYAAVALLLGISVLYPIAISVAGLSAYSLTYSSSAAYLAINRWQARGLYFALILPKLFLDLTSQILRFWEPFSTPERLHNLPTGMFVMVDQLCMCAVCAYALYRRRLSIEGEVGYFVIVFVIIYLAAPENSPRYLYFVYVLLAVALSIPDAYGFSGSRARKPRGHVDGIASSLV